VQLQDVYRLQALVTVIEEGSFSAAVNRLHLTQPALSARLKLLEENLGCALLERTSRGVKPTPIGKLVYSISCDILKRFDDLHTVVKNHLELRDGYIHLVGGETSSTAIFPKAMDIFLKSYPHVQFTIQEKSSTQILQALFDGSADIATLPFSTHQTSEDEYLWNQLQVHFVFEENFYIIAPHGHKLAKLSQSLQAQDKGLLSLHINGQPLILGDSENASIQSLIDNEFRRLGIKPKIIMNLKSSQSMVSMVTRNLGLSIISEYHLENSMTDVVPLKLENMKFKRLKAVCSVAKRSLPPAGQKFVEILKDVYSKNTVKLKA